ncbi:MAG TPA: prolyl oligopeptidase family serine peptidase, partial [Bacteroidales bacterium]|nr:prolyl oligopeptidase family serine peptidase [Bacteroidales bacterium]
MHLNQFDAKTGDFKKNLFEEQNERYVEPENPLYFIPGEPDEFLWFSERDGFQHLYHYNTEGELVKQLTKGNWLVQGIVDFTRDGKEVIFYATKNSPLNHDVFKLQIKNGKITQVFEKEGTHFVKVNQNGNFIDTYTSLDMGMEYAVISKKGKTLLTLLTDKDPMADYNLGEIEVSSLKAEDGTELYYRLIKPADFNPEKKYPVFVYVYGGPHAQLVSNRYQGGAGLFLNYMASQGYVVFTLDNRGSADRGFEFESVIHRNLGDIEVQDQMEGIKYLQSLNFVDTNRIGVDGWSYGGFMTISMKLKYPETFKVACAGGPVIDWKYYEVMYGERYMDTPQDNPEGYEKASLLDKADQLEGRLMIIHGTNDPTVVWQNSQQFVKKCVEEGKLLDYFIYPGHGHNVRGKDRVHLFRKIEQYFKTHL